MSASRSRSPPTEGARNVATSLVRKMFMGCVSWFISREVRCPSFNDAIDRHVWTRFWNYKKIDRVFSILRRRKPQCSLVPELSLQTVASPPEYLNSINESQALSLCSLSWQPWLSKNLLSADGAKSFLPLGHHLLLRQPQLTPVQPWEVKCVCTRAALIPIVFTDESWGPKFLSFKVCKGPKESHAVDINYINSGAGSKQVKACQQRHWTTLPRLWLATEEKRTWRVQTAWNWARIVLATSHCKGYQTNPNKPKHKKSITPIHHQNQSFGIAPRHWDVQKII